MHTNRFIVLFALAGVLAISACDTARPIEDDGGGGGACASCHGFPPAAPAHTTSTQCVLCHDTTVDAGNDILPGGTHQDDTVDVTFAHAGGFDDPDVHGPAAIADLASCQGCHATDLSYRCDACHQAQGWAAAAVTTNCTFCHGTRTKPTFDFATAPELAAPPEGVSGATGPADPSVGAHQAHLLGAVYSNGFACTQCHTVPADLGHIADGAAGPELVWGTLAALGTTPTFDPGALTCTNYCHGATINTSAPLSPAWTTTSAACTACHASRPSTGRHTNIGAHNGSPCTSCHIGYTQNTSVNLAYHVNGAKNVVFLRAGGAPGETYTLLTGWTSCSGCHDNNANH